MSAQYFAILTAIGEAKIANAAALGITLQITQMGVGDANGNTPTPDRAQTRLINEKRRAALNTLKVDPLNPSQIVAEQVIPEDVGGWWIRELGLYDKDNNLIAVANCAPSYKPQLAEGSGRTQVLRMVLIVSSTSAVELKIDPSVVLATRKYVDDQDAAHAGAADPHPQYLTEPEGNTLIAAAIARIVGSAPAELDTLAELAAAMALRAPLANPVFTGDPTAPTPARFDNDKSLATTEHVRRQGLQYSTVTRRTTAGGYAGTAADIGGVVHLAPGFTGNYTLPSLTANNAPLGVKTELMNVTGSDVTVVPAAGDSLWTFGPAPNPIASIVLKTGCKISFYCSADKTWSMDDGDGALPWSSHFAATLAALGTQRLPSGLLQQWCTSGQITAGGTLSGNWPTSFPNACLMAVATAIGYGANANASGIGINWTKTGYTLFDWGVITFGAVGVMSWGW